MRRAALVLSLLAAACAPAAADERADVAEQRATPCRTPTDDWGFRKLGAVRGLPVAIERGDGVLAPSVLDDGGDLHLWYTQKEGATQALVHTVSRDGGETFASPTRLRGLGRERSSYPSVWRHEGKFELLFGSGTFRRATSVDGVAFEVAPVPVLGASFEAGRFDALSIVYPSRVATDAGDVVFFAGYDGHRLRIGRAVTDAGGALEVDPPAPVLDVGARGDFDGAAVAQPHVRRAFGRWWMWYGGYDTSFTDPGPYRVAGASSLDGVAWRKHGVAIALGDLGTDAWSTRDPALVVHRGRWLMFYVGLGDDGRYRLHRAASDACLDAPR